jgi:ribonuclease P protein component
MAAVSLLISVPKKRFKRAVKRNRVKRQIREAYRKHKELLLNVYQNEEQNLMLAVIYLSDRLVDSSEIEEKLASLLVRILDNKE